MNKTARGMAGIFPGLGIDGASHRSWIRVGLGCPPQMYFV